jgi:hypothetical protein
MHEGKLVFAHVMVRLPLPTFRRSVSRYGGERKVKSFSCLDQSYATAITQLPFRESRRDVEPSLTL